MKRSIFNFLLSIFILTVCAFTANGSGNSTKQDFTDSSVNAKTRAGDEFTYNGINYQVLDAETKTCKTIDRGWDSDGNTVGGNECTGDIVIPEIVSDGNVEYKVTQIGENSFFENDITSVSMPNSIEIIEPGAFYSCPKLTSVHLSDNLKKIGYAAFFDNPSLKSIVFPDNCVDIDYGCLYKCTSLESVKLPALLTVIESDFFRDCVNLREIEIPQGVTNIRNRAFFNCKSLTSIVIPENVERIGFQNTTFNGYRVFEGCPFTRITYNANYPILTDESNFSEEVYSNAVLYMPNATMDLIKNVTPWNLFSHIEAAEDGGNLAAGDDFEYEGIMYTVLDPIELTCETKAGILDEYEQYHSVINYNGELVIPEIVYHNNIGYRVTSIREGSFAQSDITSISLPNSITSIQSRAFFVCQNLKTVYLSKSLESIGWSAFAGCFNLESIELPESLEYIDLWGFANCHSLKSIEIPESCKLDSWAIFYRCFNLSSVTLPSTCTSLCGELFKECKSLAEIKLPLGLTSIGQRCFEDCSSLKKIYNTNDLKDIKGGAFSRCERLETFVMPASLENIGDTIFANCSNLASIVWEGNRQLPDNVLPEITNPNLLLYVNNEAYAPAGFDRTLVVKDETSGNYVCKNLIVTPGYPFYAVRNFISNNSTFTKEFTQETPIEGCAGWETIVLPFDAKSVSVKDARGELTPFALVYDFNTQYPFWLFEADSKGDWKDAFGIQAGVPYIISMPNNPSYSSRFNIDGPVTFSNSSPTLITTETTSPYSVTWTSGRQFRSLWTSLDKEEAENAMGLNVGIDDLRDDADQLLPPGSAFHIGVKPKPLEAYVTHNDSQRAFRIRGGEMAGILPVLDDKGLCMSGQDGDLVLRSIIDRNIEVYSASGMLVRRLSLKAGESFVVRDLTPGIYIVAGRKVAVR